MAYPSVGLSIDIYSNIFKVLVILVHTHINLSVNKLTLKYFNHNTMKNVDWLIHR